MGKKSKKTKNDLEDKGKKENSKKNKIKKLKTREAKTPINPPSIDPSLRSQMIETAAYYIAEKHGFDPRKSIEDWAMAEREIDRRLKEEHQG
ncbi:MAG: DUF2934 domain-containing protein [Candidatus Thiodiazotropha sp. LLP2]